ncbi:aminoacetone oxidase family FAD-binding enzyme [Nitratidesulfovibrio liaohensis]|uniref:aminoacetone oxidase family FAD-binding enzyme n=1 Tax=Nitratidesulfovibrio liaohensis TaxID=2604158 RepID=UPI001421E5A5|nr:NAD(P)/FAD-dependent oxidoreductase [Nitratidesulfovibrio liaohensis]
MTRTDTDVLILGAGASGLFCAMTAAARGRRVTLVDHARATGRKVRIAGGGKCNFTNLEMHARHYVGDNPHFPKSALARFTPWDMVSLVSEQAIAWEEREHGQLFCLRSADDVADLLEQRCRASGCRFLLGQRVEGVEHDGEAFVVTIAPAQAAAAEGDVTTQGGAPKGATDAPAKVTRLRAVSLVVATGSAAWPQIGATDMGHRIARQFGHKVAPSRPVLVPLAMAPQWPLHGLAGIALPARVTTAGTAFTLPLLFTHRGISGPAALQTSCYWQPGQPVEIDFLPGENLDALLRAPEHGKLLVRTLLGRLLPDRLAERLVEPDLAGRKIAELSRAARAALHQAVHAHTAVPTGTEGMRKAEAAAGGVRVDQISSRSMESTLCPGLFFTGEVLDVTGQLGGYNLHWAWASGKAAGEVA